MFDNNRVSQEQPRTAPNSAGGFSDDLLAQVIYNRLRSQGIRCTREDAEGVVAELHSFKAI